MNGQLRLTVIGAGYLGITHAACMASLGFEVLGVETDPRKVDQLRAGHLPIYEPGLGELLRAGLACGRLTFTTSYPQAAAFGDVHFICAGTPPQPGSDHADVSQVYGCIAALAPGSLGSMVARRNIVDGRNALEPTAWRDAGWNYRALGVAADSASHGAFSREIEHRREIST